MRRQVIERPSQGRGHRVESGHEHQEAEGEQILVLDGCTVDLEGQCLADDVVLGFGTPLGDDRGEPSHHGLHGRELTLPVGFEIVRGGVQDRVFPFHELIEFLDRHAHELEEDRRGEDLRELAHEVHLVVRPRRDLVGQSRCALTDVRFERLHPLG